MNAEPVCDSRRPVARLISRPTLRLLLATAALAAVWLIVLPALLHLAPIRNHVDHLDDHNVDASALYYTDLDPTLLLDNRASRERQAPVDSTR